MPETLQTNVYADTLYDGISSVPKHNVLVQMEHGIVTSISEGIAANCVPREAIRTSIATPGFIDIQINGAGDVVRRQRFSER